MPTAVEEKDAIREVLAEYCFRLDDGRFTEMAELFADDGTWETAFGKATGRAAIDELARSLRARADPRPRAVHLVTNTVIALEGERATVRSNWIVMQNSGDGPRMRLPRRNGKAKRALAVRLSQDRSLHRLIMPRALGLRLRQTKLHSLS